MTTQLIPRTTIVDLCAHRDSAMAQMEEATRVITEGHRLASEAQKQAQSAHGASTFSLKDRSKENHYTRLFEQFDAVASLAVFRKQLDARVWMHVLSLTGMSNLMDRTAKEQLDKDLCEDVPIFTEESARQVFEGLLGDAHLIFQRGLARSFGDLDRRFKSHDGFKIGGRIILTRVFDEHGFFNYHSRMRDTLADIERVFAVLDGTTPDCGALSAAISADRQGGGCNPRQSFTETPYFRIRCFQNGNAHLWFKRDDLVERANAVLADYYGEVLPDADPGDSSPDDIRSKSGLPALNLSFYPTPDTVVRASLKHIHPRAGDRVLEPSAGTGNMVHHLLQTGADVHAVEIDPDRTAALQRIRHPHLTVQGGNFLQMPATPVYDYVVMNPPFYGTHWMEHVVHAFDFLKPGGRLVAVLPVSAEFGDSKKHEVFREWAAVHGRKNNYDASLFTDLPAESFLSSGTRISTVILSLRKS